MINNLATKKLLGPEDTDRFASMVSNLLEELVTLSERVEKLEGSEDVTEIQDRVNAIVDRVMAPLA
jgi:hypothetical protein